MNDPVHSTNRDYFVPLGHGCDPGLLLLTLLFLRADEQEVEHHDHQGDHDDRITKKAATLLGEN